MARYRRFEMVYVVSKFNLYSFRADMLGLFRLLRTLRSFDVFTLLLVSLIICVVRRNVLLGMLVRVQTPIVIWAVWTVSKGTRTTRPTVWSAWATIRTARATVRTSIGA